MANDASWWCWLACCRDCFNVEPFRASPWNHWFGMVPVAATASWCCGWSVSQKLFHHLKPNRDGPTPATNLRSASCPLSLAPKLTSLRPLACPKMGSSGCTVDFLAVKHSWEGMWCKRLLTSILNEWIRYHLLSPLATETCEWIPSMKFFCCNLLVN